MEEDKLKDIFSGYDPDISPSITFMERLERNLNAVEIIYREKAAVTRHNRLAVAIASCAGFITGVIFTLLFPYINAFVLTMIGRILDTYRLPDANFGIQLLSWLLIGCISVFVSLNTYTLSSTLLSRKP